MWHQYGLQKRTLTRERGDSLTNGKVRVPLSDEQVSHQVSEITMEWGGRIIKERVSINIVKPSCHTLSSEIVQIGSKDPKIDLDFSENLNVKQSFRKDIDTNIKVTLISQETNDDEGVCENEFLESINPIVANSPMVSVLNLDQSKEDKIRSLKGDYVMTANDRLDLDGSSDMIVFRGKDQKTQVVNVQIGRFYCFKCNDVLDQNFNCDVNQYSKQGLCNKCILSPRVKFGIFVAEAERERDGTYDQSVRMFDGFVYLSRISEMICLDFDLNDHPKYRLYVSCNNLTTLSNVMSDFWNFIMGTRVRLRNFSEIPLVDLHQPDLLVDVDGLPVECEFQIYFVDSGDLQIIDSRDYFTPRLLLDAVRYNPDYLEEVSEATCKAYHLKCSFCPENEVNLYEIDNLTFYQDYFFVDFDNELSVFDYMRMKIEELRTLIYFEDNPNDVERFGYEDIIVTPRVKMKCVHVFY